MVDHDRPTRRQRDLARIGRFDLVLDLETRKKRHVVAIAFDAIDGCRHHVAHELLRLLENVVSIDQDFADIRLKIVADCANHQTTFLVDEEGTTLLVGRAFDSLPQLHQVIKIPLQFFGAATNGSSACDQTHTRWHLQLIHYIA